MTRLPTQHDAYPPHSGIKHEGHKGGRNSAMTKPPGFDYRFRPPGEVYDEPGGEEDSSVASFKNGSIS